jgi:undecaprenyl-diphosphatase
VNPLVFIIAAQVIVESIPVSSSGHMVLAERLLSLFGVTLPALPKFFDHLLHGPTILVLLIFFRKDWWGLFRNFVCGLHKTMVSGRSTDSFKRLMAIVIKVFICVIVADAITGGFYFFKGLVLEPMLFFSGGLSLLIGFLITMLVLFSLYFAERRKNVPVAQFNLRAAAVLGCVQGLTLLPGISRFATTYVVARWLGIPQRRAFQASFLILFPLICAGFFVNGIRSLIKFPDFLQFFDVSVIATFIVSSILAYLLFYFAWWLARRGTLWWFGYYMLLPISVLVVTFFQPSL